jgi:nitrate/nitrite transporter NarK
MSHLGCLCAIIGTFIRCLGLDLLHKLISQVSIMLEVVVGICYCLVSPMIHPSQVDQDILVRLVSLVLVSPVFLGTGKVATSQGIS